MTTNNGWLGKPGVPLNPEKDGRHWVSLLGSGHPQIMEWFSDAMVWADGWTVEACAKHLRYLGPVLTPDEAAALQKRCEEAERERDALRRDASQEIATDEMVRRLQHLGDWQAADRIEALQARVAELEEALRDLLPEAIDHRYAMQSLAVVQARSALTGGKDE